MKNKADVERALKLVTGKALKRTIVRVGATDYDIAWVRYDGDSDCVVIRVEERNG